MWNILEKGLIWQHKNFLRPETVQLLTSYITNSGIQINTRSSSLEKPKYAHSRYHYGHIKLNFSDMEQIYNEVCVGINSLFAETDKPLITCMTPKTSNMFLKLFFSGSHYDMHAEDSDIFGNFAYIIYLSDETSGEIIFPSEVDQNTHMENIEKNNWSSMKSYLKERAQEVYYPEKTIRLLPQKNTAVVFRTGTAHKVAKYNSAQNGRLCLTGFPFAKLE
jgi:hypothetical protein